MQVVRGMCGVEGLGWFRTAVNNAVTPLQRFRSKTDLRT